MKKIRLHKITILPNPIATELSKLRKQTLKKEKIILTVGRLAKHKNHELLLKAFIKIKPTGWKVIIIGDGDQEYELKGLIKKYNLSEYVKIISNVKRIDKYYNEASIFVFTSKMEGFPNALLEAMHFGLPSISTDCDFGPSDLIKDGENGFLVPIDNQAILESRITRLINDEKLRNQFSINSKVTAEPYQSEKVVAQWEKLINSLI